MTVRYARAPRGVTGILAVVAPIIAACGLTIDNSGGPDAAPEASAGGSDARVFEPPEASGDTSSFDVQTSEVSDASMPPADAGTDRAIVHEAGGFAYCGDCTAAVCGAEIAGCGHACQEILACQVYSNSGADPEACVCKTPAGAHDFYNYVKCMEPQVCPNGGGQCDELCLRQNGPALNCTATGPAPLPTLICPPDGG
jgi:hypothetical protein